MGRLTVALIAFTPYGAGGASSRVRIHEWLSHLAVPHTLHSYISSSNASPRTLAAHLPAVARAERALRCVDVSGDTVLLHRGASPLSSGEVETRLLRTAARSIYDFDDALQWDVRRGVRRLVSAPAKAERCARVADVVIAGSELLADWASRFAREVHLVPSCVEPERYVEKTNYELGAVPRLGWVGSPSTERHLLLVQDALLALHRQTGARLSVVSAGDAPLGLLDEMVDRVAWTAHTVGSVMSSFDLAIAPLTAQLFPRGKCAYKILQYGAAALPIIGAPVGVNRQVLGRLGAAAASTAPGWLAHLSELLSAPPADRAAMGARARRGVEEHYSFTAWGAVMSGLLAGRSG